MNGHHSVDIMCFDSGWDILQVDTNCMENTWLINHFYSTAFVFYTENQLMNCYWSCFTADISLCYMSE